MRRLADTSAWVRCVASVVGSALLRSMSMSHPAVMDSVTSDSDLSHDVCRCGRYGRGSACESMSARMHRASQASASRGTAPTSSAAPTMARSGASLAAAAGETAIPWPALAILCFKNLNAASFSAKKRKQAGRSSACCHGVAGLECALPSHAQGARAEVRQDAEGVRGAHVVRQRRRLLAGRQPDHQRRLGLHGPRLGRQVLRGAPRLQVRRHCAGALVMHCIRGRLHIPAGTPVDALHWTSLASQLYMAA